MEVGGKVCLIPGKIFLILCATACVYPHVWAEVITLKSGKTVEGTVLERGKNFFKVDVSGVPLTYYFEDISGVDGKGLNVYLSGGGSIYGDVSSYRTGIKPASAPFSQVVWPTAADTSYAQGISEWTKWSMNASLYMLKLQSIANKTGVTYQSLYGKLLQSTSAGEQERLIGQLRDLASHYFAEVSAMTPPGDLSNYHYKVLDNIRTLQSVLESAFGNNMDDTLLKLSHLKQSVIASLQELKRVCQAHQAPAGFIARIDNQITQVEAYMKNI